MILPIAEAAEFLEAGHRDGANFTSLPASLMPADLRGAYDIQDQYVHRLTEDGKRARVGYKIGLTSLRMQAMCGIDQPIAGRILSGNVREGDGSLRLSDFGRLGLEFEIGVRIGKDLDPAAGPFDRDNIADIVEAICPAIELVDDRNADYTALDVRSLVADNSWNGGAVLGPFKAPKQDLAAISGQILRDGEFLDRGQGSDVLGHPFEPLAWLANHLASRGQQIKRGDIVLTGSICPTVFPTAGPEYLYALEGVGELRVRIED